MTIGEYKEWGGMAVVASDGTWPPQCVGRHCNHRHQACICSGTWMSVLPPPPCPVHGQPVLKVSC